MPRDTLRESPARPIGFQRQPRYEPCTACCFDVSSHVTHDSISIRDAKCAFACTRFFPRGGALRTPLPTRLFHPFPPPFDPRLLLRLLRDPRKRHKAGVNDRGLIAWADEFSLDPGPIPLWPSPSTPSAPLLSPAVDAFNSTRPRKVDFRLARC